MVLIWKMQCTSMGGDLALGFFGGRKNFLGPNFRMTILGKQF